MTVNICNIHHYYRTSRIPAVYCMRRTFVPPVALAALYP